MYLREVIIGDVIEALELPLGDRWFVSNQELHSLIGKWSQPRWRMCVQASDIEAAGYVDTGPG